MEIRWRPPVERCEMLMEGGQVSAGGQGRGADHALVEKQKHGII